MHLNDPSTDTATVLTPAGPAAIAVVRVAGAGIAPFLEAHFSKGLAPSRCVHGELHDGETVIDDPLVILSDDARSAEIHLHGGPWVLAATLNLLRREQFDVIELQPTPLPIETVAGKTLLEREILAYLPLARTEQGIRSLLGQKEAASFDNRHGAQLLGFLGSCLGAMLRRWLINR